MPHRFAGMQFSRCACSPSRELLPLQHRYLFSLTPLMLAVSVVTYKGIFGGSCREIKTWNRIKTLNKKVSLVMVMFNFLTFLFLFKFQDFFFLTCIQPTCLLAIAQWASTDLGDLNRCMPSRSSPAGPLNSSKMALMAHTLSWKGKWTNYNIWIHIAINYW